MNDDIVISPAANRAEKTLPVGRQADRLAMLIAGLGTLLSVICAIWFFAGFAENDTRPEHLTSVFVLTLALFAFAIIPFSLVTVFARSAFRNGTRRTHLLWTLFLLLPWILLGGLAISHAPLPIWSGIIMVLLATLLCFWAGISLILEYRHPPSDTEVSQQNEVQTRDS